MKPQTFFGWFKSNWQKVGIIVGVYYTLVLLAFYTRIDVIYFAIFLSFPLYILHECEEYLLPGGFSKFFNENILGVKITDEIIPVDEEAVFWINILYVWVPLPIFSLLSTYNLVFAAWLPYFFIFQAVAHIGMGIKGKMLVNPGIRSSLLIHLPYAIWLIALFRANGVIESPIFNIHLVIGIALNLLLPIIAMMPNKFGLMNRYHRRISEK